MKKIIKQWEKKLVNAKENCEIHLQASVNKEYSSDMRELARSMIKSSEEYIELLETTIKALERIDVDEY